MGILILEKCIYMYCAKFDNPNILRATFVKLFTLSADTFSFFVAKKQSGSKFALNIALGSELPWDGIFYDVVVVNAAYAWPSSFSIYYE